MPKHQRSKSTDSGNKRAMPSQAGASAPHLPTRVFEITSSLHVLVRGDTVRLTRNYHPYPEIKLTAAGWNALKQHGATLQPSATSQPEGFPLTDTIYLSCKPYEKAVYVHIRYWKVNAGKGLPYPTKDGISMRFEAWQSLVKRMPEIDEALTNPQLLSPRATPSSSAMPPNIITALDNQFWAAIDPILTPLIKTTRQQGCSGCETNHPSQTEHDCLWPLDVHDMGGIYFMTRQTYPQLDAEIIQAFRARAIAQGYTPDQLTEFLASTTIQLENVADFAEVYVKYLETRQPVKSGDTPPPSLINLASLPTFGSVTHFTTVTSGNYPAEIIDIANSKDVYIDSSDDEFTNLVTNTASSSSVPVSTTSVSTTSTAIPKGNVIHINNSRGLHIGNTYNHHETYNVADGDIIDWDSFKWNVI